MPRSIGLNGILTDPTLFIEISCFLSNNIHIHTFGKDPFNILTRYIDVEFFIVTSEYRQSMSYRLEFHEPIYHSNISRFLFDRPIHSNM